MSTRREKIFGFTILSLVAAVIAAGVFMSRDWMPIEPVKRSNYFVYDLPTVITNVTRGERSHSIRINLKLELANPDDSNAVDVALSGIMQSVIEHLQQANVGDLNDRNKLQELRDEMQRKIQSEMGGTTLYGLLFDSIQVE